MPATRVVRQLRNGKVTIPKEFRAALGLADDDLLSIQLEEGKLPLSRMDEASGFRGSPWLRELYDMFAPMRTRLTQLSDQEVNDLIDKALAEVRARES